MPMRVAAPEWGGRPGHRDAASPSRTILPFDAALARRPSCSACCRSTRQPFHYRAVAGQRLPAAIGVPHTERYGFQDGTRGWRPHLRRVPDSLRWRVALGERRCHQRMRAADVTITPTGGLGFFCPKCAEREFLDRLAPAHRLGTSFGDPAAVMRRALGPLRRTLDGSDSGAASVTWSCRGSCSPTSDFRAKHLHRLRLRLSASSGGGSANPVRRCLRTRTKATVSGFSSRRRSLRRDRSDRRRAACIVSSDLRHLRLCPIPLQRCHPRLGRAVRRHRAQVADRDPAHPRWRHGRERLALVPRRVCLLAHGRRKRVRRARRPGVVRDRERLRGNDVRGRGAGVRVRGLLAVR
jgi:hypothetical protein